MKEPGTPLNPDETIEDATSDSGSPLPGERRHSFTRSSSSRSWFTLSSTREERFFLLLAVFIGLFSGLAVVCFRLAIDWTRI